MNLPLELKKRQVEIMKVQAAKAEQELRIEEYHEQILRLHNAIKIQDEHIDKLQKEIKELKERM